MRLLAFLLSFILLNFISAQSTEYSFGPGQASTMIVADDGNILMLSRADGGISLKKISGGGTVIWNQIYMDEESDYHSYGSRIVPLATGNYLILGQAKGINTNYDSKALVIKVASNGDVIWSRVHQSSSAYYDAIAIGTSFILTGWEDTTGASDDGKLTKINSTGGITWDIGRDVAFVTYIRNIFWADDGNLLITGRYSNAGAHPGGVFIQKITPDTGAELWTTEEPNYNEEESYFQNDFFQELMGAVKTDDGNILMTSAKYYASDIEVYLFSQSGDLLEKNQYGSSTYSEVPHSLTPLSNGDFLITGRALVNGSNAEEQAFAMRLKPTGQEEWRRYYDFPNTHNRFFGGLETADGRLWMCGMNGDGDGESTAYLLQTGAEGHRGRFRINGTIHLDANDNCQIDATENRVKDIFVKSSDGQTMVTNNEGEFTFFTNNPEIELSVAETLSEDWTACEENISVSLDGVNSVVDVDFVLQTIQADCPIPEVSITMPALRRCRDNSFRVNILNKGHLISENQVLTVKLAEELQFLEASLPIIENGQTLTFELGNIAANATVEVEIEVNLDCEAQLGATHAISAALVNPCESTFSGAIYTVDATCDGEDVIFTLENIGGQANIPTEYRVFTDHLLAVTETPISLAQTGSTAEIRMPADGRTWYLEVNQQSGSPLGEKASLSIEACGLRRNGLHSINYEAAYHDYNHQKNQAKVYPLNTILEEENSIKPTRYGYGLYYFTNTLHPIEFTAKAFNPFPETATEVVFDFFPNQNFDLSSFELLTAKSYEIKRIADGLRVTLQDVSVEEGELIDINFRLTPRSDAEADTQGESLFITFGQAYFNCRGPVDIGQGYHNYSLSFPVTDENDYDSYPDSEGIRPFGGRRADFGTNISLAADGDLYLGGETGSFSDANFTAGLVVKTNRYGEAQYFEAINEDGGLMNIKGTIPLANDRCVVVGNTKLNTAVTNYLSDYHPFISMVDESGTVTDFSRFRPVDTTYGAWIYGIIPDHTGGGLIHGYTENEGNYDAWFRKINAEGETEWQIISEDSETDFRAYYGTVTPNGNFVFIGTDESVEFSDPNIYWQKISASGQVIFAEPFIYDAEMTFSDITTAVEGGYMLHGYSLLDLGDGNYVAEHGIAKYDEEGNFMGSNIVPMDSIAFYRAEAAVPIADGSGYFVTGQARRIEEGSRYDMSIMRIDNLGQLVWMKLLGNPNNNESGYKIVASDEYVYAYGNTQSREPTYNLTSILGIVDLEGTIISDIEEVESTQNTRSLLYPNPASSMTQVILSPVPTAPVDWILYDINGRQMSKGITYNGLFSIDLAGLSSGVYLVHYSGNKYPASRLVKY